MARVRPVFADILLVWSPESIKVIEQFIAQLCAA